MGLTVDLKPSGFRPVGGAGSLVYQFTESTISGKPNYRVEIEFDSLTIPKIWFRPDSDLVISCDISTELRSVLAMVTSTANRLKNTYVKYQAVWDGGSDAQVPLNSDVIYFYIGTDNELNHRSRFEIILNDYLAPSAAPFLAPAGKLKTWLNRTVYLDFLHDDSLYLYTHCVLTDLTGTRRSLSEFNGQTFGLKSSGFGQNGGYNKFDVVGFLDKTDDWTASLVNPIKMYYGSTYPRIGQTFLAFYTGVTGVTIRLKMSRVGNPDYDINFFLTATAAGLPTTVIGGATINTKYFDTENPSQYLIHLPGSVNNGTTYAFYMVPLAGGVNDINNCIQIYTSNTDDYSDGTLVTYNGSAWSADANKDMNGAMYQESSALFATKEIELVDGGCKNPIHLRWLNDYGGLAQWLFDYDQVYELDPEEDGRFLRQTVFSMGVLFAEWQYLQELNKQGVDYGDNQKVGQFVQDITDIANPVNVFTIADNRFTQTKFFQHLFQIILRYPKLFNIDI